VASAEKCKALVDLDVRRLSALNKRLHAGSDSGGMGSTSKNVTVGGQGGDKSTTNVNRAFTGAASNTPAARQTAADDSNGHARSMGRAQRRSNPQS